MTAYTISCNEIVLYDMYPGLVSVNIPKRDHDGNAFTNSDFHNVATGGTYKPGDKITVWEPTLQGWSTFTYLQYVDGGVTSAAGHMAVLDAGGEWYKVTNEGDSALVNVPPAVCLSLMTTLYWGFFWTGGVCPQSWVTALATAVINTDNAVVNGPVGLVDCADPDQVGLTAAASAVNACGFSLGADA